MSAYSGARASVIRQLVQAGIEVVADPRGANPPCVFINAPSEVRPIGRAGFGLDVAVYVVGTPPAAADTLEWMLETLEKVQLALIGQSQTPATLTTVDLGPRNVPAYGLTVTININRPT